MARPIVRVGEILPFEVKHLAAADGSRADCAGVEVRLPGGVPGDQGRLAITRVGQHAAWGRIVELTTPSPDRIEPPCPMVDRCGACPWQHTGLTRQRDERLRDLHERLDPWLAEAHWRPWPATTEAIGYRTRALWMARRKRGAPLELGLFAPHSHELVPIADCAVQHPVVSQVLAHVREVLDRRGMTCWRDGAHPGQLRAVAFRLDPRSGQGLLTLVVCHIAGLAALATELMAVPGVAGVAANVNIDDGGAVLGPTTLVLAGAERLAMRWGDLELEVGPTAFVQTRHDVAELMLQTVAEWLPPTCAHLVDLYAGAGLFGLALRHRARRVTLVERDPAGADDARWNVARLQVPHAEVVTADAAAWAPQLAASGADAVVVDPPRAGCAPAVLDAMAQMHGTLVYVCCHPQALARDLPRLIGAGWRATDVQPLDMFPHTPHLEVLVRLQR